VKIGAVDTKGFDEIRSKVKDPSVLAQLLAADLNTPASIRRAGKKGLADAGWTRPQSTWFSPPSKP